MKQITLHLQRQIRVYLIQSKDFLAMGVPIAVHSAMLSFYNTGVELQTGLEESQGFMKEISQKQHGARFARSR